MTKRECSLILMGIRQATDAMFEYAGRQTDKGGSYEMFAEIVACALCIREHAREKFPEIWEALDNLDKEREGEQCAV